MACDDPFMADQTCDDPFMVDPYMQCDNPYMRSRLKDLKRRVSGPILGLSSFVFVPCLLLLTCALLYVLCISVRGKSQGAR